MHYPEPIAKLIDSFTKLPGIGPKTAVRLAFFVIEMNDTDVLEFANSLVSAKRELLYCSTCGHITDQDPCVICADDSRDDSIICVVEGPKDVDRKSTRLNSSHVATSYAVFCLKKKKTTTLF